MRLSNIRIYYQGGGTKEQAALDPPEQEDAYPEPTMFAELPAYGFFIRHVKDLEVNDVEVSYINEDMRPPFILNDVQSADFQRVKAQHSQSVPTFVLKNVGGFSTHNCWPFPDTRLERVKTRSL